MHGIVPCFVWRQKKEASFWHSNICFSPFKLCNKNTTWVMKHCVFWDVWVFRARKRVAGGLIVRGGRHPLPSLKNPKIFKQTQCFHWVFAHPTQTSHKTKCFYWAFSFSEVFFLWRPLPPPSYYMFIEFEKRRELQEPRGCAEGRKRTKNNNRRAGTPSGHHGAP